MKIRGRAIIYGDNIDTDIIIPGRYLVLQDPEELAKHAMEGIDPSFPDKARMGAIIVAGKNFGCGSSREEAPVALKHANTKCVIAESFARIFYRNAINIGLPIIEASIRNSVEEGDELVVDVISGMIVNETKGITLKGNPLPSLAIEIISAGGLTRYIRKKLGLE
ncbi:MAG: 3-isopropylmalate dehydratase small subunit [Nitrososphaeria archaeon]|nr:3-isopropylmalate dehydratase small subunit [Nitrososphaeria archaeon]